MKRKYKIINRKRFYTSMSLMVIFLNLLLTITLNTNKTYADKEVQFIEKTIEAGDTLWKIAKENKPKNSDTREIVHNIMEYNNLKNPFIYEGNTIKIPQYK